MPRLRCKELDILPNISAFRVRRSNTPQGPQEIPRQCQTGACTAPVSQHADQPGSAALSFAASGVVTSPARILLGSTLRP